jgi:hypothetical protein
VAPQRTNGLRSSSRSGESQRRQARAAPPGRSITPTGGKRVTARVLTVSHFGPPDCHGVEDPAKLRLPVHGSREKVTHGPVVPDIEAPRW